MLPNINGIYQIACSFDDVYEYLNTIIRVASGRFVTGSPEFSRESGREANWLFEKIAEPTSRCFWHTGLFRIKSAIAPDSKCYLTREKAPSLSEASSFTEWRVSTLDGKYFYFTDSTFSFDEFLWAWKTDATLTIPRFLGYRQDRVLRASFLLNRVA